MVTQHIEVTEDDTWIFNENGVPFLEVKLQEIVAQFLGEIPEVKVYVRTLKPSGETDETAELTAHFPDTLGLKGGDAE